MAKSIIQKDKICFFCGTTQNLELHHICHGTANRKLADKYGLTVWLCHDHHTGTMQSVHHDADMDKFFKVLGQREFEKRNPELNFRNIFGKNYLEDRR